MECSTAQVAPTETAQDTKLAVQPHATSTLDATKIQKPATAIQRLHQATLGTRTEDENSLYKPEITEAILKTLPA